jgi:hypothetical protein
LAHHLMLTVSPWVPLSDHDGDWLEAPSFDDLSQR